MEILKYPHPILFEKMPEVTVFGDSVSAMLRSMYKIMKESNGIGLASNQVGLRLRMFVMESPNGQLNFINPTISAKSAMAANVKEGCLSAPGDFVVIPSRAEWVKVEYQDENGNPQSIVLKGIYAVCAAHEIDHLDGKSFLQDKSLSRVLRKKLAKKWGLK